MSQFTPFTSRAVVLPINDIDTDQIIPAQFLKATAKNGLADALFFNWRYHDDGTPNLDFALNKPEWRGAQILLAGDNFGSGSSREHAAWALTAYGFRAVIATSFADIFRNNALKNGLLPIIVDNAVQRALAALIDKAPDSELTVDLAAQTLSYPDGRVVFPIDAFSKNRLLNGLDELAYIMSFEREIAAFEAGRP
jgi:3-isopropylmalate/(R)-2-methylmalate dehydratase small subunit